MLNKKVFFLNVIVLLKLQKQYYNSSTSRCGIKAFVLWNDSVAFNMAAQMVPQSLNIYAQAVSIHSGQNFREQSRAE